MTIRAIYRNGVIEPLEPVDLQENEQLDIELKPVHQSRQEWLARVRAVQQEIIGERGLLPSSAPDIAEDRLR